VTLSPQPHLNGRYTIFARVTRGLDVAGRITQGTRIDRVEVLP
jgi:cyclophilin family peptidyl-prolyl cis-trans isomerase